MNDILSTLKLIYTTISSGYYILKWCSKNGYVCGYLDSCYMDLQDYLKQEVYYYE